MFVQVTAKNVGGVFFETQCSIRRMCETASKYDGQFSSSTQLSLKDIGQGQANNP